MDLVGCCMYVVEYFYVGQLVCCDFFGVGIDFGYVVDVDVVDDQCQYYQCYESVG